MTTRRSFLSTSSLAAAVALGTPWRLRAAGWSDLGLLAPPRRGGVPVRDPDLKALAQRALEAATAAGASYADVRFTVTRQRQFARDLGAPTGPPQETEAIAVGVRALVQGAWGFVADTELTLDMVGWLGRTAAEIGKASVWAKCPPVDLGERPPVASGTWQMPGRDPLAVPDAEHQDMIRAIFDVVAHQGLKCSVVFNYERQERTFASTEGAFATQTRYTTFGKQGHAVSRLGIRKGPYGAYLPPLISPQGLGFEVFAQEKILERLPEWCTRAEDFADALPLETPGRFEVVFDADAMAAIVSTIGAVTEVDRALGYEANGDGTSYLAPVEKVLGTTPFPAGVTITANRTLAGGAATVHWDDEGVAPLDFPVIKEGMLVDYATSREFVPGLAGWYKGHGLSAQSRGCAWGASALEVPLVQTPNLRLQPGAKDTSFEELVAGITEGMVFLGGTLDVDQQKLNAMGGQNAAVYKVVGGKLTEPVQGARYLIRIPNLWKDLLALGGARSAATRGFTVEKGQPSQSAVHSVQAVAAHFRNVVVRDISKQ